MRPDSFPRLWRYINLLLTYLLTLPRSSTLTRLLFQEDIEVLQRDLQTLESCSDQWLLIFNTENCKVMKLGAVYNGQYFLHDNNKQTELLCCENEKDLGVWITKDLKWTKQCNTAANKAMSVLGMIKRSFSYISIESFKILYECH